MSRETARYDYTLGSTRQSAIVYDDDLKIHNHSDTNPARGQHSAFDLVRIHRFGHLDKDAGELPITERPSQKAMIEFAEALPQIRAARAGFEDLGPLTETTTETPERFEFLPASEYASGAPMSWIVDGILPQAELAVIYGGSGSGKSFLALDLAKAITTGSAWNGRHTVKGCVAYVCAEGGEGMKARLRAGGFSDDLRVTRVAPNLIDEKDAAAIAHSMVRTGPYVAVVIDTLAAVIPGGNENSSETMGRVLSHCKFIHKQTGALVVLISHTGKDSTKGVRGWSGIKAAADVEIEVTCRGDYRSWSTTKVKDGPDDVRGTFKLRRVTWDTDDGEVSSCVVEHVRGVIREEVLQPKGRNQVAAYGVIKPGITNLYDAINAALKLRGVKAADIDKEKRRSMKDAFLELRDKKLITIDIEGNTCGIAKDDQEWLD